MLPEFLTIDEASKDLFSGQDISQNDGVHRILQFGLEEKLALYVRLPDNYIVEGMYEGRLEELERELYFGNCFAKPHAPIAWQILIRAPKDIKEITLLYRYTYDSFLFPSFLVPAGKGDKLELEATFNEAESRKELQLKKDKDYKISSYNDSAVSVDWKRGKHGENGPITITIRRTIQINHLHYYKNTELHSLNLEDIQKLVSHSYRCEDSYHFIQIKSLCSKKQRFKYIVPQETRRAFSWEFPRVGIEDLHVKQKDLERLKRKSTKQQNSPSNKKLLQNYFGETFEFCNSVEKRNACVLKMYATLKRKFNPNDKGGDALTKISAASVIHSLCKIHDISLNIQGDNDFSARSIYQLLKQVNEE